MELNLSVGPIWKIERRHILDHKITKDNEYKIKRILNNINLKNQ